LTARRELARQAAEAKITVWLTKHAGRVWRIPDVANAVNLPVPAVNNALRVMHCKGIVERDERKKRRNGKVYPVYQIKSYCAPDSGPSWLCPRLPTLSPDQIKGIRTVLGFTGSIEIKAALKESGK
jgi:hypothetical protein